MSFCREIILWGCLIVSVFQFYKNKLTVPKTFTMFIRISFIKLSNYFNICFVYIYKIKRSNSKLQHKMRLPSVAIHFRSCGQELKTRQRLPSFLSSVNT